MRKFVLAMAFAPMLLTAAQAADLPVRTYAKAPTMAPAPTWTGFYAGVNVGYGFNDPTVSFAANDPASALLLPAAGLPSASYNVQGVLGGVQIGYNWQVAPRWLLGIE